MAVYTYQNVGTNQVVHLHGPDFDGNPLWELISGPGGSGGVSQAELDAVEQDTTGPHGISDFAELVTDDEANAKVIAHALATDPHGDRAYTDDKADLLIPLSQKGTANGVATLDVTAKLAAAQLPAIPASAVTSGTVAVARLPVGTTAGTVAAGDDPRFAASAASQGHRAVIFYAPPQIVNGTNTNEGAAAVFAKFDQIVFGAGSADPGDVYYASTVAIIARIKELNTRAKVFGYVDMGITAPSLAAMKTSVDQWVTAGADGILFDTVEFGHGVTRSKMNEMVTYCHDHSLITIINGFNPDDVMGSAVVATYNPTGTPTALDERDYYLLESWIVNDSFYSATDGFATMAALKAKGDLCRAYRASLGVKLMATGVVDYSTSTAGELDLFWGMHQAACLVWGIDSYGISPTNYSASGANVGVVRDFGYWPDLDDRFNASAEYAINAAGTEATRSDLGVVFHDDTVTSTYSFTLPALSYHVLPVGTAAGTVVAGDDSRITNAVPKGSLVFNVKDYGAVGNNSTNDLTAINAALTAASALATSLSSGSGPVVVFPVAVGYRVTGTVTVPDGVDIEMHAPIVYAGADGQTALVLGSGAQQIFRSYKGLWVKRATISSWLSESDIGVVIKNSFWGDISIREVRNFTVGVRCLGDANGFVYNTINLGLLYECKIGLDLENTSLGWCNENLFIGGSFLNSSGTYTSIDRIGIRIGSLDGAYHNNANTFVKPSFEIKGGYPPLACEGLCVYAPYGSNNTIQAARHESPDAISLRTDNLSTGNVFETAFNLPGVVPTFEDLGTRPGSIVRVASQRMADVSARSIYSVRDIHKSACYYDGATKVNVPGLTVATSGLTVDDDRGQAGLVLNANYLEVPGSRIVGFYVSTRTIKRFCLTVDAESGFGGRLRIRAFDSSGTIITTGSTIKGSQDFPYATSYGGSFGTSADATAPRDFTVASSVDYIFVGITGGTAVARLRAIRLSTPDTTGTAAAWLPQPDWGENFATTPPTAGTWGVGRRIWNAAPSGATAGWVCTASGTPGTWVAYGGGTGADVQTFTANGTWTKPAGATEVSIVLVGSGGGGGSGRKGAAAGIRGGGAGGAGGAISRANIPASSLGATESIAIGAVGTGGPSVSAADTNGTVGGNAGTSLFGSLMRVSGAFGGGAGTATGATGGVAGNGELPGAAGGAASATGAAGSAGSSSSGAAPGGGGGGGITSGDVASAGGSGGVSVGSNSTTASAGVVDGAAPGVGFNQPTNSGRAGNSGGGGAASITTNAQTGGAGGRYGGGGGGGGAALNGTGNSGAGGDGGPGICIVITR